MTESRSKVEQRLRPLCQSKKVLALNPRGGACHRWVLPLLYLDFLHVFPFPSPSKQRFPSHCPCCDMFILLFLLVSEFIPGYLWLHDCDNSLPQLDVGLV